MNNNPGYGPSRASGVSNPSSNHRYHPYRLSLNNINSNFNNVSLPDLQLCSSVKILRLELKYEMRRNMDPIWFTVDVPSSFTLYQLHDLIQVVLNWNDVHLHQFSAFIGNEKVIFCLPDEEDSKLHTHLSQNNNQWIRHWHPHCHVLSQNTGLNCLWNIDERSINVYDAFIMNQGSSTASRTLKYEYDFGADHVINIECEEIMTKLKPKDLKYPQIVEYVDGFYYAEDKTRIARLNDRMAIQRVDRNYKRQWPLELIRQPTFCYVCRKHDGCPNRTQCSGVCCDYCIKAVQVEQHLNLGQWCLVYMNTKRTLNEYKLQKINGLQCSYQEPDGNDCHICNS